MMQYDSFSSPLTGLPEELFQPFFSAGQPTIYKKGQVIYLQGQEPNFLYCLQSGTVRTGILSDQGEEKILTTYPAGSIFGEASFFDGMPRVSTAVAATDCSIICLGRETVEALFRQNPNLSSLMITYLARTVRLLSGHVDTMSFQTADKRLANLLLNHPDAAVEIHLTHEELAAALGVCRVTVSRLLGSFAKKGWVKTGYGTVVITSAQALEEL